MGLERQLYVPLGDTVGTGDLTDEELYPANSCCSELMGALHTAGQGEQGQDSFHSLPVAGDAKMRKPCMGGWGILGEDLMGAFGNLVFVLFLYFLACV